MAADKHVREQGPTVAIHRLHPRQIGSTIAGTIPKHSHMPFREACESLLRELPAESANHKILEYLLKNAVGRKNLKSWTTIESDLKAEGATGLPSKEDFQVDLLGMTRKGEAFIGSSPKGYFIIDSREDAYVTRDFYINRITVQAARLQLLQGLIETEYPLD